MLCILYVALISFQPSIPPGVAVIQTPDGGSLPVPYSLFKDVRLTEMRGGPVVTGSSATRRSFFAYARTRGATQGKTFEVISASGILAFLTSKGLVDPQFVTISDSLTQRSGNEVSRIIDPTGPLHEHLLLLETRRDVGGTSVFLFVAPQDEFYALVPDFSQMVMNHTVASREQLIDIPPKKVLLALVLLALNLLFAVYGFQLMNKDPAQLDG